MPETNRRAAAIQADAMDAFLSGDLLAPTGATCQDCRCSTAPVCPRCSSCCECACDEPDESDDDFGAYYGE